ncbi:receptor-like kinase [Trifolium pratense]|uniref:Receptor-like kinase n=1 Tax=Trifolium pratense TaxID=57577 RepID=A0A2K3LL57_TRIPR|nr:receptor-like kinase [Trifolium pratense]
MLVDKTSLWYWVLVARYGEEAGMLGEGGRNDSSWWREILRLRDCVSDEVERGWSEESIEWRVGNGDDTFFLDRSVVGCGALLSTRFQRLFDSSLKTGTITMMKGLRWDEGGAAWMWRRQLWALEEEMLVECRELLSDILSCNLTSQIDGCRGTIRVVAIPCGTHTFCSPVETLQLWMPHKT